MTWNLFWMYINNKYNIFWKECLNLIHNSFSMMLMVQIVQLLNIGNLKFVFCWAGIGINSFKSKFHASNSKPEKSLIGSFSFCGIMWFIKVLAIWSFSVLEKRWQTARDETNFCPVTDIICAELKLAREQCSSCYTNAVVRVTLRQVTEGGQLRHEFWQCFVFQRGYLCARFRRHW